MNAVSSIVPKMSLVDRHGRTITYLRLAITDRCNLRCRYCMPEEGVSVLSHDDILSYEELERLVRLFVSLGVGKIRITGGEPFVRKGCLAFMERLVAANPGIDLRVTSNGVALLPHLAGLRRIGLGGLNLSLDTMDPLRFADITRRDRLDAVLAAFHEALRLGIPLKVNSVVMEDTTDDNLVQMAKLVQGNRVALRFIELMPFTGTVHRSRHATVPLEQRLMQLFPGMQEIRGEGVETARKFSLPGFLGTIGIIEGESRKFCSSCNKVRVTSAGLLKNCLYDNGILDLRALLRDGSDDAGLKARIIAAVAAKPVDGFKAEEGRRLTCNEDSMATIGG